MTRGYSYPYLKLERSWVTFLPPPLLHTVRYHGTKQPIRVIEARSCPTSPVRAPTDSYRRCCWRAYLYSVSSSDPSGLGRLRWITALTDPASGYLPNRSCIPHLIPHPSPSATSRSNLILDALSLESLLCRTRSTSKSIYSRLFRDKNTLFLPSGRLS